MSEIKDWSTTASLNNSVAPDGFPEGMAPSDVNNSAREIMASVRKHYDDTEWRDWGHTIAYGSATTFTTASGDGDTTSIYHTGRRVKAFGTTTTTIYGTISSSAHTTQTTVTVVWDSGSLQNESLTIWVGAVNNVYHAAGFVPVGTKMVFFQASAPSGWTQDTGNNDKALRVVSGTGGGTGGTASFSTFNASHNHQWFNFVSNTQCESYNSSGNASGIASGGSITDTNIAVTTGGAQSSLPQDYYTDNSNLDTPQYIDVIVCTKD